MGFLSSETRKMFKKRLPARTNRDEGLAKNGVCVECMALSLAERRALADRVAQQKLAQPGSERMGDALRNRNNGD
jgi:hypothetical protein